MFDSAGNLFAIGNSAPPSGGDWVVRKSSDGGATWRTVDRYNASPQFRTGARGVFADSRDRLYVSGYAETGLAGVSDALIRVSDDRGETWRVLAKFHEPGSSRNLSWNVLGDDSGNLYASSYALGSDNLNYWLVHKSEDGGESWASLDDTAGTASKGAFCYALAIDKYGDLFAAGGMKTGDATTSAWVRRLVP